MFVVSPCFDLTLNLREFAFPRGVNAFSKDLHRHGTEHPPAECGFKTKDKIPRPNWDSLYGKTIHAICMNFFLDLFHYSYTVNFLIPIIAIRKPYGVMIWQISVIMKLTQLLVITYEYGIFLNGS